MLRVNPPEWIRAVYRFSEAYTTFALALEVSSPFESAGTEDTYEALNDEFQKQINEKLRAYIKALEGLIAQSKNMSLPLPLKRRMKRLMEYAEGDESWGEQVIVLKDRGSELLADIANELEAQSFYAIPEDRRNFYSEPIAWFGASVIDRYPKSERDMRDACQCYAFAQWTASVFHGMRILELGLRDLAKKMHLTGLPRRLDESQWGDILVTMRNEIKARRNPQGQALTSGERKKLDWYDEMAANFSHFNAAWRSHVSHSRADYDAQDALLVLNHVKGFLQALAKGPR